MMIYNMALTAFVLFHYSDSSYASKQCDVTLWHMALMEHLLTLETEMTQRQKSILVNGEKMVERVTKSGGPPLVNCALLNTYTYNLAPDISTQLMDLIIKDSDERTSGSASSNSDKSLHNAKAASGENDKTIVQGRPMSEASASIKDTGFANEDVDVENEDDKNAHEDKIRKEDVKTDDRLGEKGDTSNSKRNVNGDDVGDISGKHIMRENHDVRGDNVGDGTRGDTGDRDIRGKSNSGDNDGTKTSYDKNGSYTKDVKDDLDTNNAKGHETNGDNGSFDKNSEKDGLDINGEREGLDTKSDTGSLDTNSERYSVDSNGEREGFDTNGKRDNRDTNGDSDGLDTNSERGRGNTNRDTKDNANSGRDGVETNYARGGPHTRDFSGDRGTGDEVDGYGDDDDADNDGDDCYYRSADEFICNRNVREYSSDREIHRSSGTFFGSQHERNNGDVHDDKHIIDDQNQRNSRNIHDGNSQHGVRSGFADNESINSRDVRNDNVDFNDKHDRDVHNDNIESYDKDSHGVYDDDAKSDGTNSQDVRDDINGHDVQSGNAESYEIKSPDTHDDTNDSDAFGDNSEHDVKLEYFEVNGDYANLDNDDQKVKPPQHNKENKEEEYVDDGHNDHLMESTMSVKDKDANAALDRDDNDLDDIGSSESRDQDDNDDDALRMPHSKSINTIARDSNGGVVIFYDDDDDDENDDEDLSDKQRNYKTQSGDKTGQDYDDHNQIENGDEIDDNDSVVSKSDNYHDNDRHDDISESHESRDSDAKYRDTKHELNYDERKASSSNTDIKQSYFVEQTHDDNELNEIFNSDAEQSFSNNKKKITKSSDEEEEFVEEANKYDSTKNKNILEESSDSVKKSFINQRLTDLSDSSDQSKVDMEKIKKLFAQKESEQAAKIQNLELMLVKLENKILTQSVSTQSDSKAFISLENQLLKLENELMKLSQNYRKLQDDHDALKTQQRKSYLELEHFKTTPRKSEYPALADNSSSEMMIKQQTRIVEMSKLIQDQSSMAQMLHSRSEYLEDQNRKLFQVVMNQTALIASIMGKLHELGQEGLQTRIQAEEMKSKLESLRQTQLLQSPPELQDVEQNHQTLLKQTTDIHDFAVDSSVKEKPPQASKDLVSIILLTMKTSPTAHSPSLMPPQRWHSNGLNSTRLCIFHTLIIANCTPFSNIQWKACKHAPNSLFLDTNNKNEVRREKILSYSANLPRQHQTSLVQPEESLTSDRSDKHTQGEESQRDDSLTVQNGDFEIKEMQLVVPVKAENRKEVIAGRPDSDAIIDDAEVKSESKREPEPDEPSALLPKSGTKQISQPIDEDQRQIKMSLNLNDISDLIQNGIPVENEDKNGGDEIVLKADSLDYNNRGENDNTIVSDGEYSQNSRKDLEIENRNIIKPSIELNQKDNSYKSSLPETGQLSASMSNETVARFPCDANDESPECKNQLVQTIEQQSDVNPAEPKLSVIEESNEIHVEKSEYHPNVEHSTRENNDVKKSRDKLQNSGEIKQRKKAAEEAMKMHEALHRKVLYNPEHNDRPKDCYELYKQGQERNGLSKIFVSGLNVYVSVNCDITSGGWTILLKREDGLIDFYRNYKQYEEGFGASRGEHYVGNEVIHYLTNQGHYSLRADLSDWNGTTRHAHYDHFWVDGEEDDFRLHLFGYSGDAGDGLGRHNGMKFSTFDVDNDLLKVEMGGSCSKRFHGAGWYYNCYTSNLFGRYYTGGLIPDKRFDGIAWKPWLGPGYSLKTVVLSIRPFGVE